MEALLPPQGKSPSGLTGRCSTWLHPQVLQGVSTDHGQKHTAFLSDKHRRSTSKSHFLIRNSAHDLHYQPSPDKFQVSSNIQKSYSYSRKVATFIKIRKQTFSACFSPRNAWNFLVTIFPKKVIKIIWLRADIHLGKTHPKLSKCSTVINLKKEKERKWMKAS